jgi:hypothetical protein
VGVPEAHRVHQSSWADDFAPRGDSGVVAPDGKVRAAGCTIQPRLHFKSDLCSMEWIQRPVLICAGVDAECAEMPRCCWAVDRGPSCRVSFGLGRDPPADRTPLLCATRPVRTPPARSSPAGPRCNSMRLPVSTGLGVR